MMAQIAIQDSLLRVGWSVKRLAIMKIINPNHRFDIFIRGYLIKNALRELAVVGKKTVVRETHPIGGSCSSDTVRSLFRNYPEKGTKKCVSLIDE